MTVVVKTVNRVGTVQQTVTGANVRRITRELNRPEVVDIDIGTLDSQATAFALFDDEIQVDVDGSLHVWCRPVRPTAVRQSGDDRLTIQATGLLGYFGDVFMGQMPPDNHITPPHDDAAANNDPPSTWTLNPDVGAGSVVTNNTIIDPSNPRAIQLNNDVAGENAYMWQRYTIPAGMDGIEFAASAWVYVADDKGGAPAFGGPAQENRGLALVRRVTSGGAWTSERVFDTITADSPRNTWFRQQTPTLRAKAGEDFEVQCSSPDAWVVWGWVALRDGRYVDGNNVDIATAFDRLVTHLTDTSIGKEDFSLTVSASATGVTFSQTWPWHEWQNGLEAIFDLTEPEWSFDVEVTYSGTAGSMTRTLHVRYPTAGTDRTATTLTKTDFAGWSLTEDAIDAGNHVARLGDGSGPARDVWVRRDVTALNGHVKERLDFGMGGETIGQLRAKAGATLDDVKAGVKLPQFMLTGDEARDVRPGDTYTVSLDHGWAQFSGTGRVSRTEYEPAFKRCRVTVYAA